MLKPAPGPSKTVLPPGTQVREIAGEITLFALSLGIGILAAQLFGGLQSVVIDSSQTELWSILNIFNGPFALAAAWFFYRWMVRHGPAPDSNQEFSVVHPPKPLATSIPDALLGIVLAIIGTFFIGNLQNLLGVEVEEQSKILEMIRTGKIIDLIALSLSALVLAPIVEEALFRGLFFRRLIERMPSITAYLASALIFSIIHLNPSGLLIYAWLGHVFAWTYQRSGRLSCAVLVHAGNNAASLAFQIYVV